MIFAVIGTFRTFSVLCLIYNLSINFTTVGTSFRKQSPGQRKGVEPVFGRSQRKVRQSRRRLPTKRSRIEGTISEIGKGFGTMSATTIDPRIRIRPSEKLLAYLENAGQKHVFEDQGGNLFVTDVSIDFERFKEIGIS